MLLNLSQAAMRYGGTLLNPDSSYFTSVCTDTRQLARGDLFVALRGDNYDAHDFLENAALKASALVVEAPNKNLSLPQWVVPDTAEALGQLARLARDAFSRPLLAITGSGGKTTVKEMSAAILRHKGQVLATEGNLNNHLGVPQTLLKLSSKQDFAVVEMGASGPGEIAYLCRIAQPSVVVVTNVMPAHVEGFGSLAGVARAKGEIYQALGDEGTAILNLDEPWYAQWLETLQHKCSQSFSVENKAADYYTSDVHLDTNACAGFTLHSPLGEVAIQLPIPGVHNVANALAAAACTVAVGASLPDIAAGLSALSVPTGRMQIKAGLAGAKIIDDSYNANPGSVKAAIDTLRVLPGRRFLVLGDMAELGEDTRRMHREVGKYARAAGLDGLYTAGDFAREAAEAFGGKAQHFACKETLGIDLQKVLAADTVVLVKGSRSAAMEGVVKILIDPLAAKNTGGND